MFSKKYNFVIVGSGAGGGTLARELSKRGKEVLVIAERGKEAKKLGACLRGMPYLDLSGLKSKEGVMLIRFLMLGGNTVLNDAKAARGAERELIPYGISLDEELSEAEKEMHIAPVDKGLLSEGSERILEAARELGYKMEPTHKAMNQVKCVRCGNCGFGCVYGAKWSALDYLGEARRNGAEILCEAMIHEVLIENGKAKGVKGRGPRGPIEIQADTVILAAGGFGTPVILQKSGIKDAGTGLYVKLGKFITGVTERYNQLNEPVMPLCDYEFQKRGFVLYSGMPSNNWMMRFILMGLRAFAQPTQKRIGITIDIADEPAGRVYPDGTVSKPITEKDKKKFIEASSIAKEILIKAGADPKSICSSVPMGPAQIGTAAIGRVVDKDLQTKVDNLFVCDASVFPFCSPLPQLAIIVAMAKRLAKTLAP